MPPALKPALRQDGREIRDRSPQPYARKGSISRRDHHRGAPDSERGGAEGSSTQTSGFSTPITSHDHVATDRRRSPAASATHTTSGESGTEADDEHEKGAHFLKALPPPALRPRKGVKGDRQLDGGASPLLTPAQLDRDDRTLSQGYFEARDGDVGEQPLQDDKVSLARELFEKRKRAERVRRISEGALLALIGVVVISGHSVWRHLWNWHRELLSQIFTVAFVVAMYPLRVVSREQLDLSLAKKDKTLLRRFRVPASFDPASILYPTFLPVLIALSLLPQFPALLLPNLILGLASLPHRLFPALSQLESINTLGWMVAIVPLIASENTALPPQRILPVPYLLKAQGPPYLHPEILVLLYPLHQALLPPLNYLTTTSLLPVEKHMLAAGLVDLLCFSISPQATILRALLWVGGLWVLVTCTSVLHWNVILARLPRWKLRRTTSRKRSVFEHLWSTAHELLFPIRSEKPEESDADEDEIAPPRRDSKFTRLDLSVSASLSGLDIHEPKSAVEASPHETLDFISSFADSSRKRRHTMATVDDLTSQLERRQDGAGKSPQRRPRAWYLRLTPEGAALRKWLYACWVYAIMIAIVLVPVRMAVSRHALKGAEPILWGIDYMFGDIIELYFSQDRLIDAINTYIQNVQQALLLHSSPVTFSMPAMRMAIGEANTRLLLAVYWVIVVGLGVTTVTILAPRIEVDTRRKIFHATIVTMLLPTTFVDPCFCALALSLVLAVFLLLEVIRAGQVPPLGSAIGRFVAPYVDGRDLRGPVVVSHIFLLIGCAIPLWLSLSAFGRDNGGRWPGWETENETREVAMIAGIVCVGMGDAAASLIGRRYGRRKWPWIGGKSLEGSAAFAVAVMIGLMAAKIWLHAGGWQEDEVKSRARRDRLAGYWTLQVAKSLICGCGASFMEAVLTGANDNVVVPVALWLLVRGVGP